jgi:uncharacterized membrane protein YfcA
MGLDTTHVVLVIGAVLGGFVSGLAGFGAGPVVLAFWMLVLDPKVAIPVLMLSGLLHMYLNLRLVWHDIIPSRLAPIAVGGLIGIPVGTWLLLWLSSSSVRLVIGSGLATYAAVRLLIARDIVINVKHRLIDVGVGSIVGIGSGLAGIPGPIVTLWCGLRGWNKREQRAVFSPINAVMGVSSIVSVFFSGLLTLDVASYALWTIPGLFIGYSLGAPLYARLSDKQFQRIVLLLLLAMGLLLVMGSVR